jgi:hypothetical protein
MVLVRAVYTLRPLQLGTTSRNRLNRQLPDIGGLRRTSPISSCFFASSRNPESKIYGCYPRVRRLRARCSAWRLAVQRRSCARFVGSTDVGACQFRSLMDLDLCMYPDIHAFFGGLIALPGDSDRFFRSPLLSIRARRKRVSSFPFSFLR